MYVCKCRFISRDCVNKYTSPLNANKQQHSETDDPGENSYYWRYYAEMVKKIPPKIPGTVAQRKCRDLHAHDGEDEDDDGQYEAEVAESAERSADDVDE